MRQRLLAIALILTFFSLNGCLIFQLQENVKYPSRVFEKAKSRINEIHAKYPERKGIVHRVNMLIYDGESRDLIRISVPMWLVNLCLKVGLKYAEYDIEKSTSPYFDLNLKKLTDLSELGPGLLLEVEDLEENTHVLIWLE
jgi:hypothetical protein